MWARWEERRAEESDSASTVDQNAVERLSSEGQEACEVNLGRELRVRLRREEVRAGAVGLDVDDDDASDDEDDDVDGDGDPTVDAERER